jgi:hypothetical protein
MRNQITEVAVHPENPPRAKSEAAPQQVLPPRDAAEPLTADLRRLLHAVGSQRTRRAAEGVRETG